MTLESFKPRLRTSERVPAAGAFAAVIVFASASAGFFGVVAGAAAGGAGNGAGGAVTRAMASTRGGSIEAAVVAVAVETAATTGATLIGAGGVVCVRASLPRTSIINRSGSRNVKLVTLPIIPTFKTTRTFELSYWPTRICWSKLEFTGHCFPMRTEFSLAGATSMKTDFGSFASPCVKFTSPLTSTMIRMSSNSRNSARRRHTAHYRLRESS